MSMHTGMTMVCPTCNQANGYALVSDEPFDTTEHGHCSICIRPVYLGTYRLDWWAGWTLGDVLASELLTR
jgi:hypothetical protein